MTRHRTMSLPAVEVVAGADIPDNARLRADRKVAALARYVNEPILHARVRLTRSHDPALARPVIAQGNLDVNGRIVRAQVAAATAHEAVELLEDRLRRRVERIGRDWEARRGGRPVPEPHEWRHLSEPAHRPDYYPRPESERQVVRHKTFAPAKVTPDEAAFDMDLLDYDFYLFTDADTDKDSVIYRAGPTGYRLAQLDPDPARQVVSAVPLTISERPAPVLTVAEARRRLDATGLPFLFFAEPAGGRGRVLYRRYDGHYGLVRPAE
ncbi:MAG TPA: HPF/RaiA family ribosome-associated protein [Jiangellales bacterium]|nr:HPF/RaiA family ribosome-associated protein [Jiangellales bacterium]